MVDYKSIIHNAAIAFLAQGVSFALSATTALLVPKVIGVEEYGYWQLFIFYSSYTGFFHFGLNDGVYLINGGKTRTELDAESVASQFRISVGWQSVIAGLIILIALFCGFGEEREFVLVMTGISIIIFNASSYLGFVFQSVNETKLYSFSVMIDKLSFLVPLVVLLVMRVDAFEPYVLLWCFGKICCLVYCCWRGRDFLQAKQLPLLDGIHEASASIRVGVNLMFANIASMLILGVMRFAIDYEWGIVTFGMVSFAITMVNFFLQMMSQIAMVLFPALRRVSEEERRSFFINEKDAFGLFLPAAYVLYAPICILLGLWLPQYEPSFIYFGLLLPLCLFDGKMSMVSTTFMKVLRKEKNLLLINCISFAASSGCVAIGVFVIGDAVLSLALVASVIALRSIASEILLMRYFDCVEYRLLIGEVFVSISFAAISLLSDAYTQILLLSAIAYCVFLLANSKRLKDIFLLLINIGQSAWRASD